MLRLERITAVAEGVNILREASLAVEDGRIDFIVGPSGSGKTTLLRCVCGLQPIVSGEICIDGNVIGPRNSSWRERPQRLRASVGLVFQDARLLARMSVFDNVAFALKTRKCDPAFIGHAVENAARAMGFKHLLLRRCDSLSGGERRRIAIGRALALKPKLLLLDEVTSGLDPVSAGAVLESLIGSQETGMTMLVVAHQLEAAREFADRLHFVKDGTTVWSGEPAAMDETAPKELLTFVSAVKRSW